VCNHRNTFSQQLSKTTNFIQPVFSPFTHHQLRFASSQTAATTNINKPVIIGGEEPIEAEVVDAEYYDEESAQSVSQQFSRPSLFAVVQIGGKQYKVSKGDLISVEKIPVDVEQQIKFQKVCNST
jgi:hypothetical protein